jgi:hypothetical protein
LHNEIIGAPKKFCKLLSKFLKSTVSHETVLLTLIVQEANAERAVAVAQQNVNSGTINKLEAEISRLRDELARAEQRATAAEEVRYPG